MIKYYRLWDMLNRREMTKKQLKEDLGLSSNTMARLLHNDSVTTDTIDRICVYLSCQPSEIMEVQFPKKAL